MVQLVLSLMVNQVAGTLQPGGGKGGLAGRQHEERKLEIDGSSSTGEQLGKEQGPNATVA